MNILLTTFFIDGVPFQSFYDHMCRWLVNNLSFERINVKFLITSEFFESANDNQNVQRYNPILFSDKDFEYVFGSLSISITEITHKIIFNNFSDEEKHRLKGVLKEKFGNWSPDIIISQAHISGKNIFGEIYPNALCLSTENAIFSRPPFLRTLSYDPYTSQPDNFPVRFADKIKQFEITEEQNLKVEKLKKAITGIVDKYSKLDDEMFYYYKQKFDKLVLLPLVGDKYITLFKDCIYNTEFELVDKVMEKTPKNIGVFVTQADSYASLTKENIEYFSNKYPNFIYLQKTDNRGYANNSLNYFKYIDALINITSKTAFMAMLWDKPVISLAKQFNNWYKDGQGMEDLENVLNNPYKNKNNILYWYFTRYVTFEQDFSKDSFLQNYLDTKLEKYRKNDITFEFFEEINSFDKVFDYIMNPVLQYYENEKNQQNNIFQSEIDKVKVQLNESMDNYVKQNDKNVIELYNRTDEIYKKLNNLQNETLNAHNQLDTLMNRPTFLQQIFSVRNEDNHKVCRLLGIKIKFGRK